MEESNNIDKKIEDRAYYLYSTGMRSKWIKYVPREDFNESIHGYEQYIEAAKWVLDKERKYESEGSI